MTPDRPQALSHVFWIGGATDSGKSTLAQKLAERHRLQVYHYDKRDQAHHEKLAQIHPAYRPFLAASLNERWVYPEPEELFKRMLQSFWDRFPLVMQDLAAIPSDRDILAEGFGFLPELLAPHLSSPAQALWLVPTEDFKLTSMQRRGKPSFGAQVSDPVRARQNLFTRDMLLAQHIREQVSQYDYTLYEVDGSRSADETADLIEGQLALFLNRNDQR
jgi:2-phosphoglycerate kinase